MYCTVCATEFCLPVVVFTVFCEVGEEVEWDEGGLQADSDCATIDGADAEQRPTAQDCDSSSIGSEEAELRLRAQDWRSDYGIDDSHSDSSG